MLLAIDIGNTNTNLAIFKGCILKKKYNISTRVKDFNKRLEDKLKNITENNLMDCIMISTVVPEIIDEIHSKIKNKFSLPIYIVGKDVKVPIVNLYNKPNQVGQDRLLGAYAGCKFYGCPLIIIDFGTAVTFDLINKKGEYEGGIILPGIEISLKAFSDYTSLLPEVKLKKPLRLIGKDTEGSIRSGITYGFAALCDGIVDKIRQKYGNIKVIATGGFADFIKNYTNRINIIDDALVLKGINLTYKEKIKEKE